MEQKAIFNAVFLKLIFDELAQNVLFDMKQIQIADAVFQITRHLLRQQQESMDLLIIFENEKFSPTNSL